MLLVKRVAVTLDREIIAGLVDRFFPDLSDEDAAKMVAIAFAESDGIVNIIGDNFESGHQAEDSPARYDYGLFQINSQHGYDPDRLLSDPAYNTGAAAEILERQGFKAWATYNSGVYLEHMRGDSEPDVTVLNETRLLFTTVSQEQRERLAFMMLQQVYEFTPATMRTFVRNKPDV